MKPWENDIAAGRFPNPLEKQTHPCVYPLTGNKDWPDYLGRQLWLKNEAEQKGLRQLWSDGNIWNVFNQRNDRFLTSLFLIHWYSRRHNFHSRVPMSLLSSTSSQPHASVYSTTPCTEKLCRSSLTKNFFISFVPLRLGLNLSQDDWSDKWIWEVTDKPCKSSRQAGKEFQQHMHCAKIRLRYEKRNTLKEARLFGASYLYMLYLNNVQRPQKCSRDFKFLAPICTK